MKRKLELWIDAGDNRCIVDGVFCPRMLTSKFGTVWECGLFHKELRDENGLLSGPGCLQRLQECVDAEVKQ